MTKFKVGMIGLGTVGTGVFKTLRAFSDIEIVKIAVKNKEKKRDIENFDTSLITTNPYEVVDDPEIDILVEVIGGINPAWDYISKAIESGKHIVTANKELLAKKGKELFELAEKHNKVVLYEAAIAGGIPLIMPIKTIMAGNKISKIRAILNGTTNYILTKMDTDGASYEEILSEAQELGYAETDPTGDVEGYDAAYKITTLSTIAFGKRVKLENVYREGITKVRPEDMIKANELGYKIKLVALGNLDENGNADVRVHPMLVSKKSALAHINYVTNSVSLSGFPMGDIAFSGAGAGEFPTASSVVGDILNIAAELSHSDYILPMMRCAHRENINMIDISQTYNKYYLSLTAPNNIGVIGKIGTICANKHISLSTILQKGVSVDNTADITVITEKCKEADIQSAISELNDCTINSLIRVEL
ncbi:MAG: homoserine dehydrogenase [Candidatus Gastranaerophilales bacterium]|nr:homoserine dehydrogenase [Candidatus Gastranaerophilales bacterium]